MATQGRRKAAAKAMAAEQPAVAAPEVQPALLPEVAADGARGPGRPSGALSRKTRDFIAYLEARPDYEPPGLWLAKRYMRTAREICEAAGIAGARPGPPGRHPVHQGDRRVLEVGQRCRRVRPSDEQRRHGTTGTPPAPAGQVLTAADIAIHRR
jgi:hypothetical protein